MADLSMPWSARTPQERGLQSEKQVLKAKGARAHPGSGSGKIRFDGSTEEELIECKQASKSISLTRAYLEVLLSTAIRQQKQALLIIKMPGLRVECTIFREGKPPS